MESRKDRRKKRSKRKRIITFMGLLFLIPLLYFGSIKIKAYYENRTLNSKAEVIKNEKTKKHKQAENIQGKTKYDRIGSSYLNDNNERCYSYAQYRLVESAVSDESLNFWFGKNDTFTVPGTPISANETVKYNTCYVGDNCNVIYLTYDENMDDTQANRTLDILKSRGIKATFFLTYSFIQNNPDIVRRIATEGHICGNGITTDVDMPQSATNNPIDFIKKFALTEELFQKVTGQVLSKICRFPEGKYSERALDYANQMGYRTLFWSFAYKDWEKDLNSKDEALSNMEKYYHPGAIYLIHDVNAANADALDEFITFMVSKGYIFDVPMNIKL